MPYPLANLDIDQAIREIASGTLSKEIASRYGVTPYAVRKRLAQHPDYQQAIQEQAESLVERATHEAMTCTAESVAIARVRVEAAHKWASARDPAKWGQRQQVSVEVVDFRDVLQGVAQRVGGNNGGKSAQAIQDMSDESGTYSDSSVAGAAHEQQTEGPGGGRVNHGRG